MKESGFAQTRARLALFAATLLVVLSFGLLSPAHAQVLTQSERYAITEFGVRVPSADADLGKVAQEEIRNALAKVFGPDREPVPLDEVTRATRSLGLMPPVERPADLLRLGSAVDADFIVTGEVANWRVVDQPNGKQAQVIIAVYIRNSSTGIPVNGAVVTGRSAPRADDISMATMLTDAIADGAFHAVAEMEAKILPRGAVLNTLNQQILINRGARAGFRRDTRVIILRGTEQVAEGIVTSVDPDSSFVRLTREIKGVQPMDRVQAIVDIPRVVPVFNADGSPKTRAARTSGANQGLFSILILLLILGFLFLGGRGSNNEPIGNVTAEAFTPGISPGVRVSWTRDAFFRGNQEGPFRWQVWREGVNTNPVAVAQGFQSSIVDDTLGTSAPPTGSAWSNFNGIIGGQTCENSEPPEGDDPVTPPVVPGVPQRYSVELVYRVDASSLPFPPNIGGTGGTGGTGGGGGIGGGTGGTGGGGGIGGGTGGTGGGTGGTTGGTGGTTGGTGGTGGGAITYCYFATARVPARGQATPLAKPGLLTPADNVVDAGSQQFSFTSVRTIDPSIRLEYVVQVSSDPLFPAATAVTLPAILDTSTPNGLTLSSPAVNTAALFPTAQRIFWRIGVRNIEDNPGPVLDGGKRYIFSGVRQIRRT